jgi:hypothetical protein
MTLPVGCLVGGNMAIHQQNSTSESQVFVHELNQFLCNAKETFELNPLATRSIFEHLNCLLANVKYKIYANTRLRSTINLEIIHLTGSAATAIERRL